MSLALAALGTLGVTATDLLRPWPLKLIFDYVLLGRPLPTYLSSFEGIFGGGRVPLLAMMTVAIVLIALLSGAFTYLQVYMTSRIGNELVHTLRSVLFAHLQRLSLSFHNKSRSGEHMTKIVSDANTLKDVFAESALTASSNLLTFLGMFVIMFFLDWQLALVVLLTFPLLLGLLFYRYRVAKSSSKRQRKREAMIATRINEVMTTIPLVQAFGREGHEQERFEAQSTEHLEESMRNARIEAAATRTVVVIGALGTAAVVLVGALQVLAGQDDARGPPDLHLLYAEHVQADTEPGPAFDTSTPKRRSAPSASARSSRSNRRSRTPPAQSKRPALKERSFSMAFPSTTATARTCWRTSHLPSVPDNGWPCWGPQDPANPH